jgi:hypothetical protein
LIDIKDRVQGDGIVIVFCGAVEGIASSGEQQPMQTNPVDWRLKWH